MIQFTTGNLLEASTEALVNTVNCFGVMGKGIALQFKRAFPGNFEKYREACGRGEVRPGRMFVHSVESLVGPKVIINFPTKRHWRDKSKMEDIEAGLEALVGVICAQGIKSIAVPPLGCGNGGLDWHLVRPVIERKLRGLKDIEVLIFESVGTSAFQKTEIQT